MSSSRKMPEYQSHKKVWALQIEQLNRTGLPDQESDGSLWMVPVEDGYDPIKLDAGYVQKHKPKAGGFYVVYQDGYKSFSSAEPFLSGYTPITA